MLPVIKIKQNKRMEGGAWSLYIDDCDNVMAGRGHLPTMTITVQIRQQTY